MWGYGLNLFYVLLLFVLSPFLLYTAIRKKKYRDGWAEKFLGLCPRRSNRKRCIWLHAVSVGEIQLLAPLIRQLTEQDPSIECVISTTTRTGRALAEKKYPEHLVFYCPLDFTWAIRNAMDRIRPDLLVLSELELWPNLIFSAHHRHIPTVVINGRLSEKSFRGYRRLQPMVRKMLNCLQQIIVQNKEYADRFIQLGATTSQVKITGSIKFDGAESNRQNSTTTNLSNLSHLNSDDIIFLAGSTQYPEESLAIETFIALEADYPKLKLILVPRHPERFEEVGKLLDATKLRWQRRTRLSDIEGPAPDIRILLIDTVGELGAWWGRADIGFVGGSFGSRGGQNMIEPAAYGVAVCFGPHTQNFRDIVAALQSADAASVVSSGEELTCFVRRCIQDSEYRKMMGQRASSLVASSRGATEQTVTCLLEAVGISKKLLTESTAA
ncbi:MAG: 3-deoxy-D-manno-octulosonic acid transferase [Planctomycetota bacterium]|nr:3-deoxy-D-manno-octulosonic acid transferase [Planctomycetota bacterium]MEC8336887.1 3-deoxy-D-manno-octulosonic acid transferase [Planctomycetota bacterium]